MPHAFGASESATRFWEKFSPLSNSFFVPGIFGNLFKDCGIFVAKSKKNRRTIIDIPKQRYKTTINCPQHPQNQNNTSELPSPTKICKALIDNPTRGPHHLPKKKKHEKTSNRWKPLKPVTKPLKVTGDQTALLCSDPLKVSPHQSL